MKQTPSSPPPASLEAKDSDALPRVRRAGGARHEVSDRVAFYQGEHRIEGWALNLSRGGLRAIVEDPVDVGGSYDVVIADGPRLACKVVWAQNEPDGAIVGVSFIDAEDPSDVPPASAPVTDVTEASDAADEGSKKEG